MLFILSTRVPLCCFNASFDIKTTEYDCEIILTCDWILPRSPTWTSTLILSLKIAGYREKIFKWQICHLFHWHIYNFRSFLDHRLVPRLRRLPAQPLVGPSEADVPLGPDHSPSPSPFRVEPSSNTLASSGIPRCMEQTALRSIQYSFHAGNKSTVIPNWSVADIYKVLIVGSCEILTTNVYHFF